MSKEISVSQPISSPSAAAATTPPAGPDSRIDAGNAEAWSSGTSPPEERMTEISSMKPAREAWSARLPM